MRRGLVLVVVGLVAGAASAFPGDRPREIVILKSGDHAAWQPVLDGLRRGLPGRSIVERDLHNDEAQARQTAAAAAEQGAITVALGPVAARAVRENGGSAPAIFALVQDPASLGLLEASNMVGVASSLPAKVQLAAFRSLHPGATRIGVVHGPAAARQVEEAAAAAQLLRFELVVRAARSERDVPRLLRELLRTEAVDAMWLPADPLLLGESARRHLLAETLLARRPVLTFAPALVAEGALVSHGADPASVGEQIAEAVHRLDAGEPPSRIGLLLPRGQLTVNRKVADRLQLALRSEVLGRSMVLAP